MVEVLEAAELEPADLADQEGRVPVAAVVKIWELLEARFPNVPHGLEAAALSPPSAWGVLNRATAFAPRLADAVALYVRYTGLISSASGVRVVELDEGMGVQLLLPPAGRALGHVADYACATTFRHLYSGPARAHIVRVEFAHEPRGPVEAYHQALMPEVRFGQPETMTVISHAGWVAPRPQGDPAMLANLRQYLEELWSDTTVDQTPTLEPLYAAIATCALRSEFTVAALARQMGMSVRSLQRHAREHDVQISQLLELTRKANAQRLLADPRLSLAEVAFLLGYSEERAFSRAFKRWVDQTPAQFRQTSLAR